MQEIQENTTFTPENALMNVDKAISQLSGTREMHIVLQNCVGTLRSVIEEWKTLKVKEANCQCKEKDTDKKRRQ